MQSTFLLWKLAKTKIYEKIRRWWCFDGLYWPKTPISGPLDLLCRSLVLFRNAWALRRAGWLTFASRTCEAGSGWWYGWLMWPNQGVMGLFWTLKGRNVWLCVKCGCWQKSTPKYSTGSARIECQKAVVKRGLLEKCHRTGIPLNISRSWQKIVSLKL